MKRIIGISLALLTALLAISCEKKQETEDAKQTVLNVRNEERIEYIIPAVEGKELDSKLQSELMHEGYILSLKTEYSEQVPKGSIISQNPEAGKTVLANGPTLELTISAGEKEQPGNEEQKTPVEDEVPATDNIAVESDPGDDGIPVPVWNGKIKWIISPQKNYDKVYTFANGGYSIYSQNGKYGILNSKGETVCEAVYSSIDYCPAHGVVCPQVAVQTPVLNDLSLSPACGCDIASYYGTVYVYDNSRARIYMTGYVNGEFRVTDITDTELVQSNTQFPSVLYNCDTDIMMYDKSGIESIGDLLAAENKPMKYGVVSGDMKIVVGYVYDSVEYANDCYMVKQNGKYGYRGTAGQHYYPCIFDEVNSAYVGYSWVKYNGKWGIIAF